MGKSLGPLKSLARMTSRGTVLSITELQNVRPSQSTSLLCISPRLFESHGEQPHVSWCTAYEVCDFNHDDSRENNRCVTSRGSGPPSSFAPLGSPRKVLVV